MVHEVVYNEEFVNGLKRFPLEFYLIDDNQPLTADGAADKLGYVSLDLNPLLHGDAIDMACEIKSDEGERVGSLFLKIFWYEIVRDEDPSVPSDKGLIQHSWEENITQKIATEIRTRGLGCQTAFRILDKDNDQIISYEDFQNGLINILGVRLNKQEMQLYYQKMPQPFNMQNFDSIFRTYVGNNAIGESP